MAVIDSDDGINHLQVIKPARACSLLDVSNRTLRRMIDDGRLQVVQIGPGHQSRRVTLQSIEQLLGGSADALGK